MTLETVENATNIINNNNKKKYLKAFDRRQYSTIIYNITIL